MVPTASVPVLAFVHIKFQNFVVGQVSKEQVDNYAARENIDNSFCKRWLLHILNYERCKLLPMESPLDVTTCC